MCEPPSNASTAAAGCALSAWNAATWRAFLRRYEKRGSVLGRVVFKEFWALEDAEVAALSLLDFSLVLTARGAELEDCIRLFFALHRTPPHEQGGTELASRARAMAVGGRRLTPGSWCAGRIVTENLARLQDVKNNPNGLQPYCPCTRCGRAKILCGMSPSSCKSTLRPSKSQPSIAPAATARPQRRRKQNQRMVRSQSHASLAKLPAIPEERREAEARPEPCESTDVSGDSNPTTPSGSPRPRQSRAAATDVMERNSSAECPESPVLRTKVMPQTGVGRTCILDMPDL
jgi:hypothetical protein